MRRQPEQDSKVKELRERHLTSERIKNCYEVHGRTPSADEIKAHQLHRIILDDGSQFWRRPRVGDTYFTNSMITTKSQRRATTTTTTRWILIHSVNRGARQVLAEPRL